MVSAVPLLTLSTVANLYMIILQNLINSPEKLTYGREGWYFAENGEHLHYDLIMHIAKDLFELGVLESAEPAVFKTEEEVVEGAKKVCAVIVSCELEACC